jgi:hypothetical protein
MSYLYSKLPETGVPSLIGTGGSGLFASGSNELFGESFAEWPMRCADDFAPGGSITRSAGYSRW